jgi:hypothetical protein
VSARLQLRERSETGQLPTAGWLLGPELYCRFDGEPSSRTDVFTLEALSYSGGFYLPLCPQPAWDP